MGEIDEMGTEAPVDRRPLPPLRTEVLLFLVFVVLGSASAYLSVNIPHTEVHIEGRWAFGFMGFALLRRFWMGLLLAAVLSIAGPHQVPMSLVFPGNMLYAVPALATIRASHQHILSRFRSLWLYGTGWFVLVVVCYQVFNTPVTWALLGLLREVPLWPAAAAGWREQPYFVEFLLVGIVSAAGMTALRSHDALRRNQRELALTLDSIGDGVIATDARGRVVRMNPVAEELTGWTLEKAEGVPLETVFRIINARTREPAENPVERVIREGVVVGLANHTSLIARDGGERQIADSAAPLVNGEGGLVGTVMVFRDVSREYRNREALRRSRAMLQRTERITHVGSWEWDLADNTVTWSEELFRIFRCDPSRGAPSFADQARWYHPEDLPRLEKAVEEAIAHGTSYELALRIVHGDGEVRHCIAWGQAETGRGGETRRLYGSLQDVTSHRQVETALRRSEEKYRMLVELFPDLIAIHQEGRLCFINQGGCAMLGISRPEEVIGRPLTEFLPADRRRSSRERVEHLLNSGNRSPVYEQKIIRPDGAERHIEVTGIPIDHQGGKAVQIIARDITEQIHLTEEKTRLEAKFHQAQKLESVGRLAGGVAHDLNNLLTPILGYGEMLRAGSLGEAIRATYLEEIVRAGERSRDLVRQLLAFSRKQVLDFKPTDLNEVLSRFQGLLRRTIREDIAIRLIPAPSLPLIQADTGQLEQVIMNLAVNAQDAMAGGGTLTLETAPAELDAAYASDREGVKPGSYVMLSVSDTGCGMGTDVQDHLFEPFFTTKGKEKGTGLGLATVYGIVKQHGGNIWVYSEPGHGATFKVYLPVFHGPPAASETEPEGPGDLSGTETILLVEDNQQVRELTHAVLRRHGYMVLLAEHPEAALRALETHQGPVHLLLTDVVMPGMSGKDLYDAIVDRLPGVRVLFMSGYTDDVIAQQGVMEAGLNFIQKPFSVKDLAVKVREVMDKVPPTGSPGSAEGR